MRDRRGLLGVVLFSVGLLTAAVWCSSLRYYTYYAGADWSVHSYNGLLDAEIYGRPRPAPKGWHCSLMTPSMRAIHWRARTLGMWGADRGIDVYLVSFVRGGSLDKRHAGISVALWPWPVLLSGTGAALWLSARRARRLSATGCSYCGYSRTGLSASALCPECGRR